MSRHTRFIAAHVIVNVSQHGQSLTAALDAALASVSSAQDAAFIQAVCYGVCRYHILLSAMLDSLLDKPLKDDSIKALALVGLYQLHFMRVKTHAAVSETVLAVPRNKPWAKGLINALLRNYLRDTARVLAAAQSVAHSHPAWLLQRLQADWGDAAETLLHANNQQAPMVLRVNLAKISRENYQQQLAAQAIEATAVDFCPSALVLQQAVSVDKLPDFALGVVSVQDTAAQLAATLLDVQAGHSVLDVCAAPGGKTAHILEMQPKLRHLVAVDIDTKRLARVAENLQRLQLSAELIVGDATQPQTWWKGQLFERILLDAPCSALGVIRRHPDIKLLRRAEDIAVLAQLQQAILSAIWPLLAPQGVLLYATCSVLKQENEQQLQTFLAAHPDAEELPITADWGQAATVGRQILTGDMDGFYYARLLKQVTVP